MKTAQVLFHGFKVPLLGIGEEETLQECEDCHDVHDFQQTWLSEDGHFRCDKCTANNARLNALTTPMPSSSSCRTIDYLP